ncbi:MAG: 30S ribosomal protein S20 [Syntrophobacterales bacterium RBG_19FT_COMBO_59_10]|nr:MAG: 30S ribosomal protein S20 [Syntrophobacterales bacterium RBG_19FT_COMBO_59_10]
MATHKSAIKRSRQSGKHRERNAAAKSSIKTGVKTVLEAVKGKDQEAAKAALTEAVPAIAKASAKGAIHKKTAARRISRLTKKVNALKA